MADELPEWDVLDMMLDSLLDSVSEKLSKAATPPPSASGPLGPLGGSPSSPDDSSLLGSIDAALSSVLNKLDSVVFNTAEAASNQSAIVPPPGGPPSEQHPAVQNVPIPPPATNAAQQAANDILKKLAEHTGTPQGPPGGGGGQQPPGGPPNFGSTPLYDSGPPPGDAPDERSMIRRVIEGIGNAIAAQFDHFRRGLEHINRTVDDPTAMIERGRERGSRIETAIGFGIRSLQEEEEMQGRELRGIGDLAGGVGELAGGVPVVGKPVESFFKLTETVAKSVDKLKQWNDRLHEGNLRFAEFSGSMFAVQQEQEARRIQLSMERGERLAESAKYQAEGKARLDRVIAEVEDPFKKLKNLIAGFVAHRAADLGNLVGLGLGQAPPGQSLQDWMRQVQEEESKRPNSLIPPPRVI